jgi:hypothetical protein
MSHSYFSRVLTTAAAAAAATPYAEEELLAGLDVSKHTYSTTAELLPPLRLLLPPLLLLLSEQELLAGLGVSKHTSNTDQYNKSTAALLLLLLQPAVQRRSCLPAWTCPSTGSGPWQSMC